MFQKEKIFKALSYVFITLIIGLIIITFGMPDFIGSTADADRFLAARIDNEVITRKEVSQVQENFIRSRLGGQNIPPEFAEQIKLQMLEQMIDQKLFLIHAKASGMTPVGNWQSRITRDFLKNNFPVYLGANGFDFDRFDKEILQRYSVSLKDLEADARQQYTFTKNWNVLQNISATSNLELLEQMRMKNSTYSLSVVIIDKAGRDKAMKSLIAVSEADIQNRFKTDYLAKDSKDSLTPVKREAIVATIINERKSPVEKKWLEDLNQEARKLSLEELAKKHGQSVYALNNVALNRNLDEVKPEKAPSLQALQDSNEFQRQIFSAALNQVIGPIDLAGNLYVLKISDRKKANLPTAAEFMASGKKIADLADEKSQSENQQMIAAIRSSHQNYLLAALFQTLKSQSVIKRMQEP